ncbi:hypothetical protein ACSBR1_015455 [Camellia fascicularis]
MNYNGTFQKMDLWYNWLNSRNFNIIQNQLGNKLTYDLEWNNDTSYVYTMDDSNLECQVLHVEVGILKPNWLDSSNYLSQHYMDGFFAMFERRYWMKNSIERWMFQWVFLRDEVVLFRMAIFLGVGIMWSSLLIQRSSGRLTSFDVCCVDSGCCLLVFPISGVCYTLIGLLHQWRVRRQRTSLKLDHHRHWYVQVQMQPNSQFSITIAYELKA